jgi:hypothetical protein
LWIKLLANKWQIPHEKLESYAFDRSIILKNIFPVAERIVDGVNSADIGLHCCGNVATFMGFVGEGNQSVQSAEGFPMVPYDSTESLMAMFRREFSRCLAGGVLTSIDGVHKALRWCLLHAATLSSTQSKEPSLKKVITHSTPFFISQKQTPSSDLTVSPRSHSMYILPRPVAYYEVRITRANRSQLQGYMQDEVSVTECVAVGLATKGFLRQKRLPGWDSESFGYHGDDGAIFHGRGRQLASYGPSFGHGDVVGCGIDYRDRSVFFTLNGQFLGTAFSDLKSGLSLHPTVGIDAAVTTAFNFGKEPFEYDLPAHLNRQPCEAS